MRGHAKWNSSLVKDVRGNILVPSIGWFFKIKIIFLIMFYHFPEP